MANEPFLFKNKRLVKQFSLNTEYKKTPSIKSVALVFPVDFKSIVEIPK